MDPVNTLTKGQRDLLAWLCAEQAVSRDSAKLMKDKHRLPASALVRKGFVRMDLCRNYCRNMLWLTHAGHRACDPQDTGATGAIGATPSDVQASQSEQPV